MSGFLDLGPLGVELKRLITDSWRDFFLHPHGFVEVSTPIITPHKLLEASGHVENFKDPMTECTQCHRRFRADQLVKEQAGVETEGLNLEKLGELMRSNGIKCPECGGVLGAPQYFMTMFKTSVGPYGEDPAYGRPEAAQGIFVNFRRISEVMRERFPIGVAQVGTVLRNEISPRQGPIRLREFTIMDFELFFSPDEPECPFFEEAEHDLLHLVVAKTRAQRKEDQTRVAAGDAIRERLIETPWMAYFMSLSKQFLVSLGISEEHQRFFEKLPSERAHYSTQTFDHEVRLDKYGWVEVAGFAYRSDYDLRQHMQATGTDMRVFRPYPSPRGRTVDVVKLRHERIREVFGSNAGKVLALLASKDLISVVHSARGRKAVRVDQYEVPLDCFEMRKENVKETGNKFLPHVVEPSFGVERLVYATLEYGLRMKDDRLVLSLPSRLAPLQVSVFPLVNRDGLQEKATTIFGSLLHHGFRVEYDDAGSIGRRYARADEAGIPVGVTVDYDTLKDNSVTLRDRDSWAQVRVPVDNLGTTIGKIVVEGFPKPPA